MQMGADGRESDELMGQATLTISGDTAARMLRGERATVAVTLDSTTSVLTSGKDPKKQGADLGMPPASPDTAARCCIQCYGTFACACGPENGPAACN